MENSSSFELEYDDCGEVCGETGETLIGFCDDCKVKCEKDSFRDLTETALKEKFKNKKYPSFEDLEANLHLLLDLEDMPRSERSVKTHRLLQILNGERSRKKRIELRNQQESE